MKTPAFDLQPEILENDLVKMTPLKDSDFERLYTIASDPLIWDQHPVKDRYKREVFQFFFDSAVTSKGAFVVFDKKSGETIGSTRYYDYDPLKSRIGIGYTFLGRKYWGGQHNRAMKKLLLDYAFQHVDDVIFHVGANNMRSQNAILKIGATKVDEYNLDINGMESLHFEYVIHKNDWQTKGL